MLAGKKFWLEKLLVGKKFCMTNVLIEKTFERENFVVEKKNCGWENILVGKIVAWEKVLLMKNVLVGKNIFVVKFFWLEKLLGHKVCMIEKKIWSNFFWKIFGQKFFFEDVGRSDFGWKFFSVSKNILSEKMLVRRNLFGMDNNSGQKKL